MRISTQLNVRVAPKLKRRLERIAKRLDKSMQDSIEMALAEWLDNQEAKLSQGVAQ